MLTYTGNLEIKTTLVPLDTMDTICSVSDSIFLIFQLTNNKYPMRKGQQRKLVENTLFSISCCPMSKEIV